MGKSGDSAEAWRFGAPVAGYAWRAPEPQANLILMHGLGEYAHRYVDQYSALIPSLNAAGISVFAFDLHGHGASPGPRAATDLKAAVRHHRMAREALSGERLPLFLFGHSLGGLITAASVAEDAAGVAGVVLSAPALQIELNPVLRAIAGVVAMIAPAARLVPALDDGAISRDEAVVAAYDTDPDIVREAPSARLGATAMSVLDRAWKRFPGWQVPVLILHGDADRLTPVEGSRRFFDTVPASDSTLEIFEGGYHELLNDFERERALAQILGWLEKRIPARV